jgi:hypothetical protein
LGSGTKVGGANTPPGGQTATMAGFSLRPIRLARSIQRLPFIRKAPSNGRGAAEGFRVSADAYGRIRRSVHLPTCDHPFTALEWSGDGHFLFGTGSYEHHPT